MRRKHPPSRRAKREGCSPVSAPARRSKGLPWKASRCWTSKRPTWRLPGTLSLSKETASLMSVSFPEKSHSSCRLRENSILTRNSPRSRRHFKIVRAKTAENPRNFAKILACPLRLGVFTRPAGVLRTAYVRFLSLSAVRSESRASARDKESVRPIVNRLI